MSEDGVNDRTGPCEWCGFDLVIYVARIPHAKEPAFRVCSRECLHAYHLHTNQYWRENPDKILPWSVPTVVSPLWNE
jgi:hypothetical protein